MFLQILFGNLIVENTAKSFDEHYKGESYEKLKHNNNEQAIFNLGTWKKWGITFDQTKLVKAYFK